MKIVCLEFGFIESMVDTINDEKLAEAVVTIDSAAGCHYVYLRVSDQHAKQLAKKHRIITDKVEVPPLPKSTQTATVEAAERFPGAA